MTTGGLYSEAQAPPLPTLHRLTLIAAPRWLGNSNRRSREGPAKRSLSLRAPGRFEEPRTDRSRYMNWPSGVSAPFRTATRPPRSSATRGAAASRATRDLFLAQRFARHASPLTTVVYTHASDEEMYATLRGMES